MTDRALVEKKLATIVSYDDVDLAVVEDIVRHRLDDLLQFVTMVSRRLV